MKKRHLFHFHKPRYIRCYDNQGQTLDRYTIVFTKKKQTFGLTDKTRWRFIAICSDSTTEGVSSIAENETLIDKPTYSHIGKRIDFDALPLRLKCFVFDTYNNLWNIKA